MFRGSCPRTLTHVALPLLVLPLMWDGSVSASLRGGHSHCPSWPQSPASNCIRMHACMRCTRQVYAVAAPAWMQLFEHAPAAAVDVSVRAVHAGFAAQLCDCPLPTIYRRCACGGGTQVQAWQCPNNPLVARQSTCDTSHRIRRVCTSRGCVRALGGCCHSPRAHR